MASSVSGALWADLYYLYLAIALVVGALVVGWLLYSLVKFRSRPGMPKPIDAPRAGMIPAERGHPIWSYVMAIGIAAIMFGLAFGTISATDTIEKPPVGVPAVHMDVTGFQFGWKVNYTGEGGIPFQRINEWTVPVDTPVVMNVTSQDVWHNFALTEYRIRIDAIPGEINHIWFQATEQATVQPVCVQICGTGHALMKSTMHVVSKEQYATYLQTESEKEYGRLAGQYDRNPANGAARNATLSAQGVFLENATFVPGKPLLLTIQNQGAQTVTLTAGGAMTSPIAPGAVGRLYVVAPTTGSLDVTTSNGATTTLTAVSK